MQLSTLFGRVCYEFDGVDVTTWIPLHAAAAAFFVVAGLAFGAGLVASYWYHRVTWRRDQEEMHRNVLSFADRYDRLKESVSYLSPDFEATSNKLQKMYGDGATRQ